MNKVNKMYIMNSVSGMLESAEVSVMTGAKMADSGFAKIVNATLE